MTTKGQKTRKTLGTQERFDLLLIAGQEICKRGYSPRDAAEVLGLGGATDDRAVNESPVYRMLCAWHKQWTR